MKMNVKKGDNVVVIAGKDKGKKGKVLTAFPKTGKVIVEGVAMATKHKKPRSATEQGGIIHQETAIDASNVMHICPKCDKPTRIARSVRDNGVIDRVCKHCGENI